MPQYIIPLVGKLWSCAAKTRPNYVLRQYLNLGNTKKLTLADISAYRPKAQVRC